MFADENVSTDISVTDAYRQFDAAWEKAEEYLRTLGCFYEIFVPIDELSVPVDGLEKFTEAKLAWAKVKETWRICLVVGEEKTPIASGPPLYVRLAAVSALTDLFEAARDEAESISARLIKAAQQILLQIPEVLCHL